MLPPCPWPLDPASAARITPASPFQPFAPVQPVPLTTVSNHARCRIISILNPSFSVPHLGPASSSAALPSNLIHSSFVRFFLTSPQPPNLHNLLRCSFFPLLGLLPTTGTRPKHRGDGCPRGGAERRVVAVLLQAGLWRPPATGRQSRDILAVSVGLPLSPSHISPLPPIPCPLSQSFPLYRACACAPCLSPPLSLFGLNDPPGPDANMNQPCHRC